MGNQQSTIVLCGSEQSVISKACSLYFLLGVKIDIYIASHIEHRPNVKLNELVFIMICVSHFITGRTMETLKVGSCPNDDNFVHIFFGLFCVVFK